MIAIHGVSSAGAGRTARFGCKLPLKQPAKTSQPITMGMSRREFGKGAMALMLPLLIGSSTSRAQAGEPASPLDTLPLPEPWTPQKDIRSLLNLRFIRFLKSVPPDGQGVYTEDILNRAAKSYNRRSGEKWPIRVDSFGHNALKRMTTADQIRQNGLQGVTRQNLEECERVWADLDEILNISEFPFDAYRQGASVVPLPAVDPARVPVEAPELPIRPGENPAHDQLMRDTLNLIAADPEGRLLAAEAVKSGATIGWGDFWHNADAITEPESNTITLREYQPQGRDEKVKRFNFTNNLGFDQRRLIETICHELAHTLMDGNSYLQETVCDGIGERIASRILDKRVSWSPVRMFNSNTDRHTYGNFPGRGNELADLKQRGFVKPQWETRS